MCTRNHAPKREYFTDPYVGRISISGRILLLLSGVIIGTICLHNSARAVEKPENYNECILRFMPGTQNDRAATAIEQACAAQYSKAITGNSRQRQKQPRQKPNRNFPRPQAYPSEAYPSETYRPNTNLQPSIRPVLPEQPLLIMHGTHLKALSIETRGMQIIARGAEQLIEMQVYNDDEIYTVYEMTIRIQGTKLRQEQYRVTTHISPKSAALIRLRTPRITLSGARFTVEAAKGVQYEK